MIDLKEALKKVLENRKIIDSESVKFTESLARVLRQSIISDVDMPPFNRSGLDGFACNADDSVRPLKILGTVRAGETAVFKPAKGECVRIMTGAPVPENCNFVFGVEDSQILGDGLVRFTGEYTKSNISLKGEDVRKGETVIAAPKLIAPQDIAVMAAVGATSVIVSRKPAVGILSTGDELVEPDTFPGNSNIRNSNAYQLAAQTERCNVNVKYYGIAPDSEDATFGVLSQAIDECEILLITGGVSMGDFDFIPDVLKKAGVKILFDRVNVQPGKPTTFGVHKNGVVFGLPGNPVSAFIQFETLVRPFIYLTMGLDWKAPFNIMKMGEKYERKSASRYGWIPVKRGDDNLVYPVEYHGSAHIAAFPEADGIIGIDAGKQSIEKGEEVSVRQI